MLPEKEEPYRTVIISASIAIPILVAFLFKVQIHGYDFSFLPPIYAAINGITAVFLVTSYWAIKNKKRFLHETLNKMCLGLSASFLVMYVLYHMTTAPTTYGGSGPMRTVYLVVLLSHIVLSVAVIPLVLFTFSRALAGPNCK